jgi:cobalt-zinc-cadmium efflux system membrane fusion protein
MAELQTNSKKSLNDFKNLPVVQKFLQNKPLLYGTTALLVVLLIWGLVSMISGMGKKPIETPKPSIENTIQITPEQSKEIKSGSVGTYDFQEVSEAVGVIDFNKYKTADVYSPYQGRVNKVLVEAGQDVKKGQTLFTVYAPDIAQASSTLLSTAGILRQANETFKRAKELYEYKSISLREFEQNQADQQAAEANFLAAKKSMTLFGFSDSDIDGVINGHKIDVELNVKSPMNGRVITRTASTGQLVQPGNAPAPFTISDTSTLWMVAQVPESETPLYKLGQKVNVRVQAYKDRLFPGKIVYIGDAIDPTTRRLQLYAQINDPEHELKPQMIASFTIELTTPESYPAIPEEALVREGNGTRIVWVTTDGKLFKRRIVRIGITQAGLVQILDGLQAGEVIALNKALFLSNLYSMTH